MRHSTLLNLFILLGLSACAPQRPTGAQNPANRPTARVSESFRLTPTAVAPELKADAQRVSIRRAALEKEFLLNASLIPQLDAPSFHSLKSRVVFFRRAGGKLVMIEASKGLLLTRDYPQTLPLAEFAILAETEDDLTFDFNAGMNRVLLGGDWQAHEDNAGTDAKLVAKTSLSYISRAEIVDERTLEVHQPSVAELGVGSIFVNVPIETVYFLTPYRPDPDFEPTRAPRELRTFGYFEARAQFNDESGEVVFASKVDIKKPVVYAISHNTPAKYRDAVRDGVLYWNKAFGREVLRVVDAGHDVAVPSPLHNVVQWVDFESARFAYADAQMDPRTGQVLHQQIYLTSGFARAARTEIGKFKRRGSTDLALARLGGVQMCNLRDEEVPDFDVQTLLGGAVGEGAKVERAIADMIRFVVAHEVGHTLGLRHNFAGSLAANYDLERRPAIFRDYFETGRVPADLVVTSSAMEYPGAVERFVFGRQVAQASRAAEHDEKAIRALYFGQSYQAADVPAFCTDSQTEVYADCQPMDAGRSPVEWIKASGRHWIERLPHLILDGYVRTKAPEFGQLPGSVASYHPDTKLWASYMFEPHADLSKLLRRDLRLLSVERQFANRGPAFQPAILAKSQETLAAELARAGGFEGLLLRASPKLVPVVQAEIERQLERPEILRGTSAEGKPYEFTTADVVEIKSRVPAILEELAQEMARAEVLALGGRSPLRESRQTIEDRLMLLLQGAPHRFELTPLTAGFAEYLAKRSAFFLFATRGEPLQFKKQSAWASTNGAVEAAQPSEELTLTLPKFAYPFDLRVKSIELLKPDRGESPAWGHHERRLLGALFAKVFGEAVPGIDPANTDALDGYPSEVVRWVLEAREIGVLLELGASRTPRPGVERGAAGGI